jgi:hypothetical protein
MEKESASKVSFLRIFWHCYKTLYCLVTAENSLTNKGIWPYRSPVLFDVSLWLIAKFRALGDKVLL